MMTRNNPLVFAGFAWKNFIFIEQAAKNGPGKDLHPVTQLALSLLGLIVFQHEKNRVQFNKTIRDTKLHGSDWPLWNESKRSKKLGTLVENLRHAVAHGDISFNSISHNLPEVTIYFCKRSRTTRKILWTGDIRADHLREFCCRFKTLLEANVSEEAK